MRFFQIIGVYQNLSIFKNSRDVIFFTKVRTIENEPVQRSKISKRICVDYWRDVPVLCPESVAFTVAPAPAVTNSVGTRTPFFVTADDSGNVMLGVTEFEVCIVPLGISSCEGSQAVHL